MKLSNYNLFLEAYPTKRETVIFNTRTQAIVKIEEKLKNILKTIPKLSLTETIYLERYLPLLTEMGIVVEDAKEEEAKLEEFFSQLKKTAQNLPLAATILTTDDCNFACPYCFEEEVRGKGAVLDKVTGDKIITWLKKKIEKREKKALFLAFYGGEPLLNPSAIKHIGENLSIWCERENIEFEFTIITNGSLLTLDIVEELKSIGLSSVRITLDGTKNIHDKRRPLKDGRGSFDLIIRNIEALKGKISVEINGNYDEENYQNLFSLLAYLEQKNILNKIDSVNFGPVVPRLGPDQNPSQIGLSHCLNFFGNQGMYEKIFPLKEELKRRGFEVGPSLVINSCSLLMEEGEVVIDPDGIIYKCPSLLGYKEFSVGSVENDSFNEVHEKFLNIEAWRKCPKGCAYLPLCGGGCRLFAYFQEHDLSAVCCKKDFFERITPLSIKLDYQRELGESKKS